MGPCERVLESVVKKDNRGGAWGENIGGGEGENEVWWSQNCAGEIVGGGGGGVEGGSEEGVATVA